ncbi:MAG: 30S ribosomal protein S20 [Candidatus Dadabacteria bacterium]|nr:30S ribosomal protein S20 [Candidatus Dadabacteria bacterium]NIQ16032.1 30S ribosomal protein S20 [Candidatus Dadabacteria bacterium]
MGLRKKSAIKKHRQSLKRKERNKYITSTLKTKIKRFDKAIEEKDVEKSKELLKDLTSSFDKASTKGVIHKRNSARKISRFTKKFHSIAHTPGEES